MNSVHIIRKHILSCVLIFAILSCSFWGIRDTLTVFGNSSLSSSHNNYAVNTSDLSEFICSEEISPSASQASLVRLFSLRKHQTDTVGFYFSVFLYPFIAYLISLAFLSLCHNSDNYSHRFIMKYIHNKDGQKE